MNDEELLHDYIAGRSERAFAELVQRHIALVYSVALRCVGRDAQLAEDVAQQVFTALARKAPSLRGRPALSGWLYVSTHHAAAALVRRERRRKTREAEALAMNDANSPDPAGWQQLRPVLDDAMVQLRDDERAAVMLRFFEKRSFGEIGGALRVTEEAARKRVERALDKLHGILTRRGITSTTAALGTALGSSAAETIPAGLAAKVSGVAIAQAAAGSALSTVASVAVSLMPAAAVIALGAFIVIPLHRANQAAISEIATLPAPSTDAATTLRNENRALARTLADFRDLLAATADLPRLRTELAALPPPAAKPVSNAVTITSEGQIAWGAESVEFLTLDAFLKKVAALHASAPDGNSQLVIHARGSRFAAMVYAVDEARKAGIKHIVVESDAALDPEFSQFSWF
jgi:RNA polymerase sigma factor (sigma-70 family)